MVGRYEAGGAAHRVTNCTHTPRKGCRVPATGKLLDRVVREVHMAGSSGRPEGWGGLRKQEKKTARCHPAARGVTWAEVGGKERELGKKGEVTMKR
jgi:hypothetical protein